MEIRKDEIIIKKGRFNELLMHEQRRKYFEKMANDLMVENLKLKSNEKYKL